MMNVKIHWNPPAQIGKAVAHLNYIAKRAGVDFSFTNDKMGDFLQVRHGLFDLNGTANFNQYMDELKEHKGVVYRGILMLSKLEAAELGFNDKGTWSDFINSNYVKLSKAIRIPLNNLRLVMAYHPEGTQGHNPHVHFVAYEKKPIKNCLNDYTIRKDDLKDLRKELNKSLYHTDEIIQEKNIARDSVLKSAKDILRNKPLNKYDMMVLEDKLLDIVKAVPKTGRLYFQYMPPDVKAKLEDYATFLKTLQHVKPFYQQYIKSTEEYLKTFGLSDDKIQAAIKNADADITKRVCNQILREIKGMDSPTIKAAIKQAEHEADNQKRSANNAKTLFKVFTIVSFLKSLCVFNDAELMQFLQMERAKGLKEQARHVESVDHHNIFE